jgi:hypothetical protein
MRIYHGKSLLRVLDSTEETLYISGVLESEIARETDAALRELPKDIQDSFNKFMTTSDQTIPYVSTTIVQMPDEFTFHLDITGLARLAREALIRMIPLYANTWQARYVPIADLWIGERGELLSKSERRLLRSEIDKVWALPIRGKIFVLDPDGLPDPSALRTLPAAIREAGGVVVADLSPSTDYYVTDRPGAALAARASGARRVLNTLEAQLMVEPRD